MLVDIHVNNVYSFIKKPMQVSIRDYLLMQQTIAKYNIFAPKVDGAWFSSQYRSGRWDGRKHFISKEGKFPSGLLERLVCSLQAVGISCNVIDLRRSPYGEIDAKYAFAHGIELRDYQKEAISICLDKKRGTVAAATNSGKTDIACALFNVLPGRCLMITHRIQLLEQTIKRLETRTDDKVGSVEGGDHFLPQDRLVVGMVQTLAGRVKSDPKQLKRWLSFFDCVVVDEAHRSGGKTYQDVLTNCTNAFYRFGLTGTPGGSNIVQAMDQESFTGPVIFTIRNEYLISEGYSSKPVAIFVSMPEMQYDHDTYEDAYTDLVVANQNRNDKIAQIAIREASAGRQVLIIVNIIAHGEEIQQAIGNAFDTVPFIHGSSDKEYRKDSLQSFADGELPVLISSSILKEGVDVPTIGALIYAAGGKSKVSVIQTLGRSLRRNKYGNSVLYYDFVDYGNKHLQRHSLQRMEILSDEGIELRLEEYNDITQSSKSNCKIGMVTHEDDSHQTTNP